MIESKSTKESVANAYNESVSIVFRKKEQETNVLLLPETSEQKIKKAINNNYKNRFALSSIILIGLNDEIYKIYSEVQTMIQNALNDGCKKRGIYLERNQLHLTIFIDEITYSDSFFLSLTRIKSELEADAKKISPFYVKLMGPILMPDGVIVMEYSITEPEFLYLREESFKRSQARNFPKGHFAFKPNIFHSNIFIITDNTTTRNELMEIKVGIKRLRNIYKPHILRISELAVASAIEESRTFKEVKLISLSQKGEYHEK